MFRSTRLGWTAAAAAGILALAACGSSSASPATSASAASVSGSATGQYDRTGWPSTITIGAIPAENAMSLAARQAPLQKLIKDKLGIEAKVFSGTSYSALIEAQKSHKVDLVQYGPFSYFIAQNQGLKLQVLGISTDKADTGGGYHSLGVTTSKNTGISSLKDFAGKKVCFVDPASTSGYLFPTYGLIQAGVNPTSGVTPVFAGAHDASVLSIGKGTCDAGFVSETTLKKMEAKGQVKPGEVTVVWKSEQIPGSPIVASESMPASLRAALQDVLVKDSSAPALAAAGYCSSEAECQKVMGRWGFADPKLGNYQLIADVCAATKSTTCTSAD
jgi:phosphonate transport system substrate-binding protein